MNIELRFEDLIGRAVRNAHGRVIGRIEDAHIAPDGDDYVITHFLLGPPERLARLRAFLGELPILRGIGLGKPRDLRPLPWNWFDLRDPDRPRLSTETGPHS
jgi:sporulation protein YlmC with PRC-barrel domain